MKKLGFLLLFGLALGAARSADAACGTFEVAKGDIKVQSAGKVVPVSTGGKICSGDTVIAGADSRAKIKMADGNELNISPESKIVIEDYQYDKADNKKKVLLNILKGKVRATTREENMYTDKAKDGQANTFQIRTKSAVAGVRGTDFLTSYDPGTNKTAVVTFKGKVEFGQVGKDGAITNSVQVGAGLSTTMVGGQAPEPPKPLPPSELKSLNSETRAESAGGTGQNDNGRGPQEPKKDEAKKDDKKDQPKAEQGGTAGSGTGSGAGAGTDSGTGSGTAAGPAPAGQPVAGEPTTRQPTSVEPTTTMAPPPPPPPMTTFPSTGGTFAPPPLPPPPVYVPTPPPAAMAGPAKVNITINVQQ